MSNILDIRIHIHFIAYFSVFILLRISFPLQHLFRQMYIDYWFACQFSYSFLYIWFTSLTTLNCPLASFSKLVLFSLFSSLQKLTKYSYSHENNKTDFRLPIHFISRNKEPRSLFPIITLTELTCFILKLILPCHNSTKNNTTRHCVRFTYYFRVTCSKAKKTIFMYRS